MARTVRKKGSGKKMRRAKAAAPAAGNIIVFQAQDGTYYVGTVVKVNRVAFTSSPDPHGEVQGITYLVNSESDVQDIIGGHWYA